MIKIHPTADVRSKYIGNNCCLIRIYHFQSVYKVCPATALCCRSIRQTNKIDHW